MWQALNLSVPASINTTADQQSAVVSSIESAIASAESALTNAQSKTQLSVNTNAATAAPLIALRASLQQLQQQQGYCLSIHPWTQADGTGEESNRWLSPANAVEQLAAKCADLNDQPVPQAEAVALLFYSQTLADFHAKLASFNAVFAVPELQMLEHRIKRLSTHATDKYHLIQAPLNPHWQNQNFADLAANKQLDKAVGALQAVVEGAGTDQNPIAELALLAAKKRSHITQLQQHWNSLKSTFKGGDAQVLYIPKASLLTLSQTLKQNQAAGHEYPLAAAVLWLGQGESLKLLKEAFSL